MSEHIGVAACSAEGAALCYRTICLEGAERLGPYGHPEITLHTPPLSRYVACLEAGDIEGVGAILLGSAETLARAGADFLICPDNTMHMAFEIVAARSPRPWLHIAEAVAGAAKERGCRRAAVLGTKWLMESRVYPDKLEPAGLQWAIPPEAERTELSRIIMDELVNGIFTDDARQTCRAIIGDMAAAGCDAAILGCTELPLILNDGNSPLPTLDSTRLLARAALRRAVGG